MTKILSDLGRLKLIKDQGVFKPNSLQLAPTDKCNLNCSFCSVQKRIGATMVYEDVIKAVDDFVDLNLKTVEITGGGEPCLYPEINELITYCYDKGLKIGFISNGVLLNKKLTRDSFEKLTWLRVSMNALEYAGDFELDIPENVTLGLSYVWTDKSSEAKLLWIDKYKKQYDAQYVRVVPNCLNRKDMDYFKKKIAPIVNKYDGFFPQSKEYTKPDRCWFGYLKPFLNSDGYIYHCSAIPLIHRKFASRFRMGHWSEIKKIWSAPIAFDTGPCDKCFFRIQNDVIEALLTKGEHEDFI